MGSSISVPKVAFHVLKVQKDSPSWQAGLDPYFDYITAVNNVPVQEEAPNLVAQAAKSCIGAPMKLSVYNSRFEMYRELHLTPRTDWGGEGLIGCSIRFCTYEEAANTVWHILDIEFDSPADRAGFIGHRDYIIGTPLAFLANNEELIELLEKFDKAPLSFIVYNVDLEACRDVIVVPDKSWGGQGCLGCNIGFGMLHKVPRSMLKTGAGATSSRETRRDAETASVARTPLISEKPRSVAAAAPRTTEPQLSPRSTGQSMISASLISLARELTTHVPESFYASHEKLVPPPPSVTRASQACRVSAPLPSAPPQETAAVAAATQGANPSALMLAEKRKPTPPNVASVSTMLTSSPPPAEVPNPSLSRGKSKHRDRDRSRNRGNASDTAADVAQKKKTCSLDSLEGPLSAASERPSSQPSRASSEPLSAEQSGHSSTLHSSISLAASCRSDSSQRKGCDNVDDSPIPYFLSSERSSTSVTTNNADSFFRSITRNANAVAPATKETRSATFSGSPPLSSLPKTAPASSSSRRLSSPSGALHTSAAVDLK